MKYALVITSYSPQKKMVIELYYGNGEIFENPTTKLSEARIWNDFDTVVDFLEENQIDDHKIVDIKEKKLFEARLKGV